MFDTHVKHCRKSIVFVSYKQTLSRQILINRYFCIEELCPKNLYHFMLKRKLFLHVFVIYYLTLVTRFSTKYNVHIKNRGSISLKQRLCFPYPNLLNYFSTKESNFNSMK